jgi:hypothetical protein
MDTDTKTTPSQGGRLVWLGGIIDGEGTVALYTSKKGKLILGFIIVNTDVGILNEVQSIYEEHNVSFSRYEKSAYRSDHPASFKPSKPCYEIVVRRRDDVLRLARMIEPFLFGEKKSRTQAVICHLENNPIKSPYRNECKVCKQKVPRKNYTFCSQRCWHEYAVGKSNPNYRHGKHIPSGVTTE